METGKPVKKRKKRSGFKAKPPTLCWDCANATSPKCPWADRGEAVPGWDAKPTKIKFSGEKTDSYLVIKCPLFRRDAEGGGACHTLGWGWKDKNDKGDGDGKCSSVSALYRMALVPDTRCVGSSVRGVASRQNERTRVLKEEEDNCKELIDLGFGIIERAVNDWKMLDYGLREEVYDGRYGYIKRKEVVGFFFSKWFTKLCEPLHYSPEEIRNALNIPEDAMRILYLNDEGRIREVFERRA